MKIALLGRGKMGELIEELTDIYPLEEANVCIDFTHPEAVLENIRQVADRGINMVVGTTGWYDRLDEVQEIIEQSGIGLVYGANFSLGCARFKMVVERAKELLLPEYEVAGVEVHHSEKVDTPSGTAKELGVAFSSVRVGKMPGTHTLIFDSEADSIEITHRARSRIGFARGALLAAEWIMGKKGLYTFEELCFQAH